MTLSPETSIDMSDLTPSQANRHESRRLGSSLELGLRVSSEELGRAIAKLIAENPATAHRVLELAESWSRPAQWRQTQRFAQTMGELSDVIGEAIEPTALQTRPATLELAWLKVGGYLRHSMQRTREDRLQTHE